MLDIVLNFSWENKDKPIAYTDLTFRDKTWERRVDETVKWAIIKLLQDGENPVIIGLEEEIALYRDIPGIGGHIIELPQQIENQYTKHFPSATRWQKNLTYAADIMMWRVDSRIKPEWLVAWNQTHTWPVLWSLFKQMGKEEDNKKLSSHFIMNHSSHTFLLSDWGVAVDPSAKELADIVYYTVLSANHYGMPASIALLDGGWNNPKIQQAYILSKAMLEEKWIKDITWHVWVSFKKAHDYKASVIVAPDLNTGNIWYKVAQRVEKHENFKEVDLWESMMYSFDSNFWNMSFVYEKQSLPNITENTEEKAKQLVDIALKSIDHAIKKWISPRLAFVSYSTMGMTSSKFQLYNIPARAAEILRKTVKDLALDVAIEWDIQFDAACIPEIAKKKITWRECEFWEQSANIFIFPDRDSGSTCRDIVATVPWSEAIGPIVDGCVLAANDLSRWAKVDDIIAMHHITKNMNKPSLK
jgi:phosphotransacetylase